MAETVRVLVVDDDPDVRDLLHDYLSDHGFAVSLAASASAARSLLDTETPSLVLLDVGLPGEDGLSLARHIRERFDVGILMISGAGDTVDRIVGLEVGADDYIAKPFDPRELKARLKSVLRRYARAAPAELGAAPSERQPVSGDSAAARGLAWETFPLQTQTRRIPAGHCVLDLDSRQLFDPDGSEIPLTRMEIELLEVLVQRPNRVLSRDQILNLTQNRDWDPFDRSVDIRIARLRRKIDRDPAGHRCIRTVRGVGYMYVPPRA